MQLHSISTLSPATGCKLRANVLQHLLQPGWNTLTRPLTTKKTLEMGFDSARTSSPQPKTLALTK
jgi:hypothetical protein